MIFLHTGLLLLFLFLLGLPISLVLRQSERPYLHFVLAPHFGLSLLVVIVVNAYVLNIPVAKTAPPLAALAIIGTGVIIWRGWRSGRARTGPTSGRFRYKLLVPAVLLLVTLLIYGLPFIINPDLAFYAYAGTDGSAYIAMAEYQMNHGAWDRPGRDIHHPITSLVGGFLRPQDNWIEKPGTDVTLAFASTLFHRLPHQMFSCLMLTSTMLLFGSIFALGQTLSYSPLVSGLAAFVGAVSPSVLVLTSNTYLSASLTLPLLPVLLLLTGKLVLSRLSVLLFVLVYQAYWLISPPSMVIPPAVLFLCLAYVFLSSLRRRWRRVFQASALMLGTFLVLNAVTYKLFLRNSQIGGYAFAAVSPVPRIEIGSMERKWEWNLFWHSVGVGPVTASPATTLDSNAKFAFVCIVIVAGLYFVRSAVKRDFSVLFFAYVSFWLMVLIGGVAGVFRSFEILGRVSQQLVFLHALVYASFLPYIRPSWAKGKRSQIVPQILLAGVLLFIALHARKPFIDFEKEALFISPQRVNQFTFSSLQVRQDLRQFTGETPIIVNSSPPNLTGLLNLAVLLSNIHLLVPPEFLKFFFFPTDTSLPADYYCAQAVLFPEMYRDIYASPKSESLFRRPGFVLFRNDLIPFLNNDTFPIKYGFDAEFLKQHSLTQARTLGDATSIFLCSAAPRDIKLQFRYSPVSSPQTLEADVSPSQQKATFVFDSQGVVDAPPISLVRGQNRIDLKPAPGAAKIDVTELSVIQP